MNNAVDSEPRDAFVWTVRAGSFLSLLLVSFGAFGASPRPNACEIEAQDVSINVVAAPAADAWGPTIEISLSHAGQTLTRLIAEESRPIETCWWTDLGRDGVEDLVIAFGSSGDLASGAQVYAWVDGHLQAHTLPPITNVPGVTWRYVVTEQAVWAYPLADSGTGVASRRHHGETWVTDSKTVVAPNP
ncbi:MAG: hypothetical protein EXR86_02115 [Gammaproteobacteria bacterium]|nr:hypothetical protein [Gammaproteobacteria bacterium]